MKQIIVKIHKGKSTVTAEGFTGAACKDATKQIEEALGAVTEDVDTHEIEAEIENEFIDQG